MTRLVKDGLGSRMKEYEMVETGRRFLPMLPIYARIDGKCFSKFTRNMERPYDVNMSNCMIDTTSVLVEKTGALVGYTQSDEISLLWYTDNIESQIFFDRRIQKMVSVLASMTTSLFTFEAMKYWPTHTQNNMPLFDCRVFQLPTQEEATNVFLWRELDATKNAVSMAARSMFSHNAIMNKNGKEMQEMMWSEFNVNFNDYPSFFKRGTFIQRRKVFKELSTDVLERIPDKHRPVGPIERSETVILKMPPFNKVINRTDVLFNGAEPSTL